MKKLAVVLGVLAVLVGALSLVAQPAFAAQSTFHMRLDTYVDKASPTTGHGADADMRMNANSTRTMWAIAQVPSSDMTLPAGATTSKTEIIFDPLETDATQVVSVFRQQNCTWTVSGNLNWNNVGAAGATYPPDATALASSTAGTTAGTDKVVDVGNFITGNTNGSNNGWCVVLKTSFNGSKANQYRSLRSANGDANLDVRARITYTTTAPQAPTVTTDAATNVTSTGATLNGTVNPNGQSTTYHFEYGTTTSYGTSVPVPDGSAGSGTTAVSENAATGTLTPSTLYHFRLVATNATGTTNGADATFTTTATGCTGVTVSAAQDVATVMAANPAGTTFCLEGQHRLATALAPEAGDVLWGVGTTATLSGSKELPTWTVSGSNWVSTRASGTLGSQADNGRCTITGCENPNDLFLDGAPLVRVTSLASLAPGKFYEDFGANQVYIRDNPTGHLIEQAVATRLIQSSAATVTVKNLILQHAASQYQQGAVEADGTGWTITYNDVRYNHGYGVRTDGASATVQHNRIHHSGQLGIGGSDCDNSLVEANEVDHNNRDGAYSWGNEAGGSKWSLTDGLTLRGNYVHDNSGAGLWTDINNGTVLVENNDVRNNTQYGIFQEIGYSATIRNNVAAYNAPSSTTGFYSGGQIVVSASRDVEVYGNTVRGRDTIGGLQQSRTDHPDARGAHEIWNLYVHDNDEETLNDGGWSLLGGIVSDDATQQPAVWDSRNNRFQLNDYWAPTTSGNEWEWHNGQRSFTTWKNTYGMDTAGTFTAGTVTLPNPPTLVTGPQ